MLDKLSGVFAPRPSSGPHKLRESLPIVIFIRNRLKYALTYDEAKKIVMQRHIRVDGKVRTDLTFPAGFMGPYLQTLIYCISMQPLSQQLTYAYIPCVDVINIKKTGEYFRLIYDVKGRFAVHRITKEEGAVSVILFLIWPPLCDANTGC